MNALRAVVGSRTMVPEVVVTPMRRRHLRAVLRIEEHTSSTPWSHGLFLAEARRPERIYLVARMGSTVVGFAGLLFALTDGHVTTIAVDLLTTTTVAAAIRRMTVTVAEAIPAATTTIDAATNILYPFHSGSGFQPQLCLPAPGSFLMFISVLV